MRSTLILALLMTAACAAGQRINEAALWGRWTSFPSGDEDERKDECLFERSGKFDCMVTYWSCASCQGDSLRYSGTWRLDGNHLSRHITAGHKAGSAAEDEIIHLDAGAVTFVDGRRWLRE